MVIKWQSFRNTRMGQSHSTAMIFGEGATILHPSVLGVVFFIISLKPGRFFQPLGSDFPNIYAAKIFVCGDFRVRTWHIFGDRGTRPSYASATGKSQFPSLELALAHSVPLSAGIDSSSKCSALDSATVCAKACGCGVATKARQSLGLESIV